MRVIFVLVVALLMSGCATVTRELSDDDWCRSFDYAEGTRQYAECRLRLDRLRQQAIKEGRK